MTAEYELALTAVREATAKFEAVRKAFRAGTIADDIFLEAKADFRLAEKVFDLAFTKEQGRGDK